MNNSSFILLIEDSPTDVGLVLSVLKKQNVPPQIITIRDGEEAVDFLLCRGRYENRGCGKPSLILLDKQLPKIDGLEILDRIKGNRELEAIPTLMFSCSMIEQDIREAYRRGANAVIEKPMDFGEFTRVLTRLITEWGSTDATPANHTAGTHQG